MDHNCNDDITLSIPSNPTITALFVIAIITSLAKHQYGVVPNTR